MQGHEQYGRPPNLRPRSTSSKSRTSSRVLTPSQLAVIANTQPQHVLDERIRTPRPGSASTTHVQVMRPTTAITSSSNNVASDTKPVVLLSKAPVKPRSALPKSALVSRHRIDRIQQGLDTATSNQTNLVNSDVAADLKVSHTRESVHTQLRLRPNSAMPVPQQFISSPSKVQRPIPVLSTSSPSPPLLPVVQHVDESIGPMDPNTLKVKRPYSAAPWFATHPQPKPMIPPSNTRQHPPVNSELALEPSLVDVLSTYHQHTFVYAVPRHCLERGRQYNPYDIVTLSHEALFGSERYDRECTQPARYDYYTVSSTGFTFHSQQDPLQPTFVSSLEWERQKKQFDHLISFSTFQLFRYRKVFVGWKTWIRRKKRQDAIFHLQSSLYFTVPMLKQGMMEIQNELWKLEQIDLVCDFQGKTLLLQQFLSQNMNHIESQSFRILEINGTIQAILLRLCLESLHQPTGHGIQEKPIEIRMVPRTLSPSKIAQFSSSFRSQLQQTLQQLHVHETRSEIRWTLAAIQRRRCIFLTKFVTLIDMMAMERYHDVIIRSIQRLQYLFMMGANAVPIATLTNRQEYLFAMSQERSEKSLVWNKKQIQRVLRMAWTRHMNLYTRDCEQITTANVWLESRLESIFLQQLTEYGGYERELYDVDTLLYVIEQAMTKQLTIPMFDPNDCCIEKQEIKSNLIQEIPSLCSIPLFHIHMELVTSGSNCSIIFRPLLEKIEMILHDVMTSFINMFQHIPSLVSHQELRAILEFADDTRTSEIIRQQGLEDEEESRWNKTNYDRLVLRIMEDPMYTTTQNEIYQLIQRACQGVKTFVHAYDQRLAIHMENTRLDIDAIHQAYRQGRYGLKDMERDVQSFLAQIDAIQELKTSQAIEFIQLDIEQVKACLLPSPHHCLEQLHALYPILLQETCETFLSTIRTTCKQIEPPIVRDLSAFARYLVYLKEAMERLETLQDQLMDIHAFVRVLEKLNIPVSISVLDLCIPEYEAFKSQVNTAIVRRDQDIQVYTPLLTEQITKLEQEILTLQANAKDPMINSIESSASQASTLAYQFEQESVRLTTTASELVWVHHIFTEFSPSRLPSTQFDILESLTSDIKLKNQVWEAVYDAESFLEENRDETLRGMDLTQLQAIVYKMHVLMERVGTHDALVMKRLEHSKQRLEGLYSVIRDVRNQEMDERHWIKLEHKMQCQFIRHVEDQVVQHLELPLSHLLEIDAISHASVIHQVSEEATAEAAIAKSFDQVLQTWETREIPLTSLKDRDGRETNSIGDCSELVTLLEESEVLLRVMECSTFARVIQTKLTKLLTDLSHTQTSIELLGIGQQQWTSLQRLISTDILRSFPDAAKLYQQSEIQWRMIIDGLIKKPLCFPFGTSIEYRNTLEMILHGFEAILKCLDHHFEIKRQVFPPFFKLSNLELAALISKTRDAGNIQPFLYQCFDNISRITFGIREASQDVLMITSRAYPYAETIMMGKNLKARGPIEQWLAAIDKRVSEMLRKGTKEAISLLSTSTTLVSATEVASIPIQSLLLADRVLRCELVERCLDESCRMTLQDIRQSFQEYQRMILEKLSISSDRTTWTPRTILVLSSLRLHEIEFQDAVSDHFQSSGIPWSVQLKYRFDDTTTVGYDCHVECNSLKLLYGFHYIHPHAEHVVTLRSMRSVFSMVAVMRNAQTCLITGASESGKQSLAQHMSMILGRRFFGITQDLQCQVPHCLKLLRGALYSGGTWCLTLQTAKSIEMMRVIGQMITQIEHAYLAKLSITGLHKDPIPWIPGTTLIVTCPSRFTIREQDEMEQWTAPFARIDVVLHDWSTIVEALLISKGFEQPLKVSHNLLLVWHHMRGIMEHQTSNLFTLRALKYIIHRTSQGMWTYTEELERASLESFLLADTILTYYQPLLMSSQDMETLRSMLEMVFAYEKHQTEWYVKQWIRRNQEIQTPVQHRLDGYLDMAAQDLALIPRTCMKQRARDILEAISTCSSVAIVGPNGVGKTTAINVLARGLDRWKQEVLPTPTLPNGSKLIGNEGFVNIRIVFPRSMTLTQLYGCTTSDAKGRVTCLLGRYIRLAQEQYGWTSVQDGTILPETLIELGGGPLLFMHKLVWIILDSEICGEWLDILSSVFIRRTSLSMRHEPFQSQLRFLDGEFMTIPPNLRFLLESMSLDKASPSTLSMISIVAFPSEMENDEMNATRENWPIDKAYIDRFIQTQCQMALEKKEGSQWTMIVYDTIEERLLKTDLLLQLSTLIHAYSQRIVLTRLQRVKYLISILQALIHSITQATLESIKDHEMDQVTHHVKQRVEMALIYALVWGFCACTSDDATLPPLITNLLKSSFMSIASTWSLCRSDVNFYEVLIDLPHVRFVELESPDTLILRDKLIRHVQQTTKDPLSSLFIPTTSSLVVHAAMKEGMRSGRGVLLIGSEPSRTTMLLRQYLKQLDTLRVLTTSSDDMTTTSSHRIEETSRRRRAIPIVPLATGAETSTTSVDRIRNHQVSLVKKLAKQFRIINKAFALIGERPTARRRSQIPIPVVTTTKPQSWCIPPHPNPSKVTMIHKFDTGDYIPFFFTMTSHNQASNELSKCLERMLQRERTGVYEPPPGKMAVLLLDDLHMPLQNQTYGPSSYELLRSVYEHDTVYSGEEAKPIGIEGLAIAASISAHTWNTTSHGFTKLVDGFVPVLSKPCTLYELYTIFYALVHAQWDRTDLQTTLLRMIIGATTVLWEKLRRLAQSKGKPMYKIQDLSRVFQGMCCVEDGGGLDSEILLRLWSHECLRTFSDSSRALDLSIYSIPHEITRLAQMIEHSYTEYHKSKQSTSRTKSVYVVKAAPSTPLNEGLNVNRYLTLFTDEYLSLPVITVIEASKSKTMEGTQVLWAWVPSNVCTSDRSVSSLGRRPSIGIMGRSPTWTYAEVFAGNMISLDQQTALIQHLFGTIRGFDASSIHPFLSVDAAQVTSGVPMIPLALGQLIAKLDRIYSRPGTRMILIGDPGSGCEVLLRYAGATRSYLQSQRVYTLEGVADPSQTDRMIKQWKSMVHTLFLRVGVECETMTLVVNHLHWLPSCVIAQLQALMQSGEIPGFFTLEEQIKLATSVRDERIVALEHQYHTVLARLRAEIQMAKDKEINEAIGVSKGRSNTTEVTLVVQSIEQKYQTVQQERMAQALLRHQQELDDFNRKREVENESITATIMSLIRPLGMTSGKWQQIIQRIQTRLRIVVMAPEIVSRSFLPSVFDTSEMLTMPTMDFMSLHPILYGSFHSQIQAVQDNRFLPQNLSLFTAVATEMHLILTQSVDISVSRTLQVASTFTKLLIQEQTTRRKQYVACEWFLHLYTSMEQALVKLEDQDQLKALIQTCDLQITHQTILVQQQQEICEQLEIQMTQFETVTHEQVSMTNEMKEQTQRELAGPMTCLEQANAALALIDKRHIIEIKSFNSPPVLVHLVLDAICVLFHIEPTWEHARRLLNDPNIVHHMLTYDKENMPTDLVQKMETNYLQDSRFIKEEVEKQSVAAAMMVIWVRAIVQYARARQQVLPTLTKMEQAQERLNECIQEYVKSKQAYEQAIQEWNETKESLAQAQRLKHDTMEEMISREIRLTRGREMFQLLEEDRKWIQDLLSQLEREQTYGLTEWNALFRAGWIVYGHLMDCSVFKKVAREWYEAYRRHGVADLEAHDRFVKVSYIPILTLRISEDKQEARMILFHMSPFQANRGLKSIQTINACGVLLARRTLQDLMWLLHTTALPSISLLSTQQSSPSIAFPVILLTRFTIEYEYFIAQSVSTVWEWNHFVTVHAKDLDLEQILFTAITEGHQVLILDVEPLDADPFYGKLSALFQWETIRVDGVEHVVVPTKSDGSMGEIPSGFGATPHSCPIHPSFRVILTTQLHSKEFGDAMLTKVPVLDTYIHAMDDIRDLIMDKLWSTCENGSVKMLIQEYEMLCMQSRDAYDQLTKLMQAAAVHGDFQLTETKGLITKCHHMSKLRTMVEKIRDEISEGIQQVDKLKGLAKMGAAMYTAFTSTTPMALHLFLPMFMNTIKTSSVKSNLTATPPMMVRQTSNRRSGRALMLAPTNGTSMKNLAYEPEHVVLSTMLQLLQPLIADHVTWQSFVLEMFWRVEYESTTTDVHKNEMYGHVPKETNLERILQYVMLRHYQVPIHSTGILETDVDMEQILNWIVHGPSEAQTQLPSTSQSLLTLLISLARPRAERLKLAVAMFPTMGRAICNRMLHIYAVDRLFFPEEVVQTCSPPLWQHILSALPSSALIILQSRYPFDSFEFLTSVFFHTTMSSSSEQRSAILKAAFGRTSVDGTRLFHIIPSERGRAVVQWITNQSTTSSVASRFKTMTVSGPHDHALMLTLPDTLLCQEQLQALAPLLDAVPLTIVNMQNLTSQRDAMWEQLFTLSNRASAQHTSISLKRYDLHKSGNGDVNPIIRQPSAKLLSSQQIESATANTKLATSAIESAPTPPPLPLVPSFVRMVAAVDDHVDPPKYLHSQLAHLSCDADASDTRPSLQRCLQETLLRLSYHPSGEVIGELLPALNTSKPDTDSMVYILWHSLTTLVLFHALLRYRHEWSVYCSTPIPCQAYSWDVFVTALDQLFHVLKHWKTVITATNSRVNMSIGAGNENGLVGTTLNQILQRMEQKVFLASYTRQCKTTYERTILHMLCQDCLSLLFPFPSLSVNGASAGSFQYTSIVGTIRNLVGTSIRTSISTGTPSRTSPLIFLQVPIELLRTTVHDADTWIDWMWRYATEQIEGTMEWNVSSLFGLPSTKALVETTPASFGWIQRPLKAYETLSSQIVVQEAIEIVQVILSSMSPILSDLMPAVEPKTDGSEEVECDNDIGHSIPKQANDPCLEARIIETLAQRYNAMVHHIRQWFDFSLQHLILHHNTTSFSTLATVDPIVQRTIFAMLHKRIPIDIIPDAVGPTHGFSAMSKAKGFDLQNLLTYITSWRKFLERRMMCSDVAHLVWWVPGLPSEMPIGHVLDIAKRKFYTNNPRVHESQMEIVFTLQVITPNLENDTQEGDRDEDANEIDTLPTYTIAVFQGLELHLAAWHCENGYLDQTHDVPQQVSVLCSLENRIENQDTSKIPQTRKRYRQTTRMCPLITSTGHVLIEFELPIHSKVPILVTPYLTLSYI